MSSSSSISKTSPMIIRLFSTSPVKQDTAATNTNIDCAQSIPECVPSNTSEKDLKRKRTEKSKIIKSVSDLKSNKNREYPSHVKKSSSGCKSNEVSQKKIADVLSNLDSSLENSPSPEFKSYTKQRKKNLKCQAAHIKELDIPILNSVAKSTSKKPTSGIDINIGGSSNVSKCPFQLPGLKKNEKSEITNVVRHVKSPKNTKHIKLVKKSSAESVRNDVLLKKNVGKSLRLDSSLETSATPYDFKSHVKERKKNPSCPVAQTKDLDTPALHSVTKSISKQVNILCSNAENNELVSRSIANTTNAKLKYKISEFKSKLIKSPSIKHNKKELTELPTLSINEPVASYPLGSNKVSVVVDKQDELNIMSEENPIFVEPSIQPMPLVEHSTNLSSEIAVDSKDSIDTKITTVKVDEIALKGVNRNVSNSSTVIPVMVSVKEEQEETFQPPLKVNEPVLPTIPFRLLPEFNIDQNIIPLSNIKVEEGICESNEMELNEKDKLQLSKHEETIQVFKTEYFNQETEASNGIVESSSLNQPCSITQEVDFSREIPGVELRSEISAKTIHEKDVNINVEDSKEGLVPQCFTAISSDNIETIEFSSSQTFSRLSDDNLDVKLDGSFVLPDIIRNTQSPIEKSECVDSKDDLDMPKHVLRDHLSKIVSPSSISKPIYDNEFEDFENRQGDLSEEVCNISSPDTAFSSEKDLGADPHAEIDKFKFKGIAVENKIKKRQYRTHASCSPDLTTAKQREDGELAENSEDPIAESTDPSWNDQGLTGDDVSDLEITELEKIRELLRQQLSQDNEDSSDTRESTMNIESELGENNSVATSASEKCMFSGTTASKSCTISDSQLDFNFGLVSKKSDITASPSKKRKQSPKKGHPTNHETPSKHRERIEKQVTKRMEKADHSKVKRKHNSSCKEDKSSCKDKLNDQVPEEAEHIPVTNKPPLVMQSSNLLFNYGLDNRHGGGGSETTDLDVDELRPRKKLKLASADEDLENADSCDPHQGSQDVQALDDQMSRDAQPLIHCEDSSSNPTLEDQDSEQNGLMEFDILDEFESDGNDLDENDDSDTSSDEGYDPDEIDAMLEEKLQERINNKNRLGTNDTEHEEKEKIVLKARGKNHFDVLPEGWIEVTHNSGMPIYLHKMSRVCSMSKPYFLGTGSTRKHEIPVSAIPCLHYLKEKEKEKLNKESAVNSSLTNGEVDTPTTNGAVDTPTTNGAVDTQTTKGVADTPTTNGAMEIITNGEVGSSISQGGNVAEEMSASDDANLNSASGIFPSANLESAKDTKESGSLDCAAVREYCSKRFDFTRITVKRFRTWSGRRKHLRQQKNSQRPFLPDSTKLITCPLYGQLEKNTATGVPLPKREFIMNPSGKSPVCILHEYVQHTLRLQPKYVFKELENASTPYGAVVVISGIQYGCGFGSSKKSAKSDAARSALEILIPKMKILTNEESKEDQDVEFFDQVRIEDPRICDLSVKAGQPYPYQILLECIKRNYGMGETTISVMMTNIKHQKNEFHMTCGKHKASVVCKNKRDGKHRASQAILQKLHPHINSWGSLLRMYGKGSCKTMKEKKEEEQQITELQSKATANKPNMSILSKLKEEMLKYREKVKSKKPIGKLIPESMEFPSSSSSNLKNVEL